MYNCDSCDKSFSKTENVTRQIKTVPKTITTKNIVMKMKQIYII